MKRLLIAMVSLLLGATLATVASAKVRVITTIPDFGAITQEIGGKHVRVKALVKPTQDPHFVDAKPSLMVELNKADLLLVTGLELESGWLPALLTGSRNADIQRGGSGYLNCSTLIPPLEVQAVDRSKGDIHPGGNPHFWTDPRNGLRIAEGITKKLAQLDPDNAADYAAGYSVFSRKLKRKMAIWKAKLAPHKGTKVVVYHQSWVYFLAWAGFERAGALEPKPGIPPKAGHVAELITKVKGQGVKYVVQESFYPTKLSQVFAQKSGAKLKVLPTMVGAGKTKTYFDVIDTLVDQLTD